MSVAAVHGHRVAYSLTCLSHRQPRLLPGVAEVDSFLSTMYWLLLLHCTAAEARRRQTLQWYVFSMLLSEPPREARYTPARARPVDCRAERWPLARACARRFGSASICGIPLAYTVERRLLRASAQTWQHASSARAVRKGTGVRPEGGGPRSCAGTATNAAQRGRCRRAKRAVRSHPRGSGRGVV